MRVGAGDAAKRLGEDERGTEGAVGRGRLVTGGEVTRREQSVLEIQQVSVGDKAPTGVHANRQPANSSPNGENSSPGIMSSQQM